MTCAHSSTRRGKNIPRVYGSWRSEVCEKCGAYRVRDHRGDLITDYRGRWRSAENYVEDIAESEDM